MTRQKAHCTARSFFFDFAKRAVGRRRRRGCVSDETFRQNPSSHLMVVRSLISCRTAFLCILLVCFDPAAVLSVLAATPLL